MKYSFEDLMDKEKMSSRMLEWKEMGFKVFSDNVSKIHLGDEEKNLKKCTKQTIRNEHFLVLGKR